MVNESGVLSIYHAACSTILDMWSHMRELLEALDLSECGQVADGYRSWCTCAGLPLPKLLVSRDGHTGGRDGQGVSLAKVLHVFASTLFLRDGFPFLSVAIACIFPVCMTE